MLERSVTVVQQFVRLRRATLAGFALTLAVLLVGGALAGLNAQRLVRRSAWESHSRTVMAEFDRLLSALKDAETGQRGYLLTGDSTYLAPYTRGRLQVSEHLVVLQQLTVDNRELQQELAMLAPLATRRLALIEHSVALMRAGDRAGALAVVRQTGGKILMDSLRTEIGRMADAERRLLLVRAQESTRSYHTLLWSIALTTAAGLVFIGVIFLMGLRIDDLRRRNAQAAAEERERLRVTLGSIGDGVLATDADGRVTFMNAVAETLLGWSEAESLGRPLLEIFPIVHEETRQPVSNPVDVALREGRTAALSHHSVLITRDGTERPIDDSAAPIRDADGNIHGAVLVFRDVTDARRAEGQLRQLAVDLAEADRRKSEFLAVLAHELRNPLAPIRNALAVMRQRGPAGVEGTPQRQALEMMDRQVQHMVRLVDDLLDINRISRGHVELQRGRVELASVVHHAVEISAPLSASLDQEVTVTLPDEPLCVEGDPLRLGQVIGNLLNNACKFTPPGGHITVDVSQDGPDALIRVRDDGVGIAAADVPRVFDMFSQLEEPLARTQGGLGIGLALVQRLVVLHGGTVTIESAGRGKGTTVTVRLPLLVDAPGTTTVRKGVTIPTPTLAMPAAGRRILVVDDNRDAAESLAMLLTLQGHEVTMAHDGQQAVDRAIEWRPDAILLDIGLPVLNGYEAARRIRAAFDGAPLLLVALTGWGQESDRRRSTDAGFDAHLVKPVDPSVLAQVLQDAVHS